MCECMSFPRGSNKVILTYLLTYLLNPLETGRFSMVRAKRTEEEYSTDPDTDPMGPICKQKMEYWHHL